MDKCKGQADNGTQVCGYREGCLRYKSEPKERQVYTDFWKGGDDCPQYISIPSKRP
jgi:hypothetical protein